MKPNLRKQFFAWMMKNGEAFSDELYGSYKRSLLHDIHGQVVEIGPGTGVNFKYLPDGISWVGIEPNEAFNEVLNKAAAGRGIHSQVLNGSALRIPLPDNSADILLCTLVLCSVKTPDRVIAEIKRVLKPGARLIFIEHVAATKQTSLRFLQNMLNPFNRLFAGGCNCNRETWTYIEQAGFSELKLLHQEMKGTLRIHSPHIMGYAIK